MRENIFAYSFKGPFWDCFAHELGWTFMVYGVWSTRVVHAEKNGKETGWRCQRQDIGSCPSNLLYVARYHPLKFPESHRSTITWDPNPQHVDILKLDNYVEHNALVNKPQNN